VLILCMDSLLEDKLIVFCRHFSVLSVCVSTNQTLFPFDSDCVMEPMY